MKTGDSSNLNLLPSQAKFQAARMKLKAILRRYMSFALVLWVTLIIVTVVLYFGSDLILTSQNKKYQQALTSYKSLSQEIILSQLLKYRAKVLGQVLDSRFEYSSAFEKVNSIFSEMAKVSRFELDENKEFAVEVLATDKNSVNYVEDRVAEANKGKVEGVKKIIIKGANYNANSGNWLVNMGVTLE